MSAPSLDAHFASSHCVAAAWPAVAGVAGGVGTSTLAAALGGRDLGLFTGRPADVVVCRATVASVLLAGRVAALCPRPVVAVTALDTGKLSAALRSRLALLEPHTTAVVVLPWMAHWSNLVDPLQELRDQLTWPARDVPRPVGGYVAALTAIHTALDPAHGPATNITADTAASTAMGTGMGTGIDTVDVGTDAELRSPASPARPHRAPHPVWGRAVRG